MSKVLYCTIVTPEKIALDERADLVAATLYDGEIGIAPGRAPLVGRLGYGEFRLRRDDTVKRYYLDGGFIQVAANRVTILTDRAIPAAEVDVRAVEEEIATVLKQPAPSVQAMKARDRRLARARGQLRVARRDQ
jgi:F-type H+-transporting ATPase subunit epsilon